MFSCNEDDSSLVTEEASFVVDARVQPFYTSFEDEAAARGHEIDLDAAMISASISEIEGEGIAGQCSFTVNGLDNEIVIDESSILNKRIDCLS